MVRVAVLAAVSRVVRAVVPAAFSAGSAAASTGQRYNLTFSVQARNLLNHVNPGPINGIVTSPLFGESNNLAGGVGAFAQSGHEPPHRFAGAIHVLNRSTAKRARRLTLLN